MRGLPRGLVVLAVAAAGDRASAAWGSDAAELAALIERQIDACLEVEKVRPVPPTNDAEFLRRAYLDWHGVIPTAEQAARFLADAGPDGRSRLIDVLLADPKYGEHLGDVWQGSLRGLPRTAVQAL